MPAGIRPWSAPLALALIGCPPAPEGDDTQAPDDSDTTPAELTVEEALYVADGPGDLDLTADGQVLIVTRYGGDVRTWDPVSGGQDVVQHAIHDLDGLHHAADDRLWAACSDGRVEGRIGLIEHNDLTVLADQADDGTPMRGVEDLALAPDGTLVTVDDIMGGMFLSDPDSGATNFVPLSFSSPQGLLFQDGALIIAGADGIYQVALPDGAATLLDARPGRGLTLWGDTLLASNTEDGVFAVGGGAAGASGIASPDDLLALGDTLYISDAFGRYLYAMDLTGWEP